MSSRDVIIIGSGLGGLSCGAILSKEGKRVCVVEKEPVPADACGRSGAAERCSTRACTTPRMADGEIHHHFLRYCGIYDSLHLQRLDEAFDVIHLGDREYSFCQGYDRFVDALSAEFPAQRRQIEDYAAALREVGNVIGVEKLRKGIVSSDGLRFLSTAASAEIEQLIGDPCSARSWPGPRSSTTGFAAIRRFTTTP